VNICYEYTEGKKEQNKHMLEPEKNKEIYIDRKNRREKKVILLNHFNTTNDEYK